MLLFEKEDGDIMTREGVKIFLAEMLLVQQALSKVPVGQLMPGTWTAESRAETKKMMVDMMREQGESQEEIDGMLKALARSDPKPHGPFRGATP